MISGYRWARGIGCSRREAARLTFKAMQLARFDPPAFVNGRVVRRRLDSNGRLVAVDPRFNGR